MTSRQQEIRVKLPDGKIVKLMCGNDDNVLHLKRKIERDYGHVIEQQKLSLRKDTSASGPHEGIGDTTLIRDLSLKECMLFVEVDRDQGQGDLAPQGVRGNTIDSLQASNHATVRSGDSISQEALEALIKAGYDLPRANNHIGSTTASATAFVNAGQLFGDPEARNKKGGDSAAEADRMDLDD